MKTFTALKSITRDKNRVLYNKCRPQKYRSTKAQIRHQQISAQSRGNGLLKICTRKIARKLKKIGRNTENDDDDDDDDTEDED